MSPETQTDTSAIESAVKSAEFAFLVIKQKDGRYAIANVDNAETERQPGLEDVFVALNVLQRDLDRQAIAMAVITSLRQVQNSQTAENSVKPEKKFVKRS